ncbi:MAG: DUF4190 domain-containing protein [Phycisphaerae bacterium]
MTTGYSSEVPARMLSKSSLASLICGILGCIPFVTGALALVLGIVGIVRTGRPEKSGRWMAVTGLILGVISLAAWSSIGLASGGIWAMIRATAAPRIAAHTFLHNVSVSDDAAAKAQLVDISDEEYEAFAEKFREQGTFTSATFYSTDITNDKAHLSGSAHFDKGGAQSTAGVRVDLRNVGAQWKITAATVSP